MSNIVPSPTLSIQRNSDLQPGVIAMGILDRGRGTFLVLLRPTATDAEQAEAVDALLATAMAS